MSDRSYNDNNEKDPSVSAVEQSEEAGITPGFLGGSDWPAGAAYKLNGEYYDGNDKKIKPNKKRGITHGDVIDLMRENIDGFDVRETYVKIVSGLKERGF